MRATGRRALTLQLEYYCELRKGDTVPRKIDVDPEVEERLRNLNPTDLATERDRKRIDDPMEWPHLRLPLVHRERRRNHSEPAYGWLFTHMTWPSDERVVFLGTIFDNEASGTEVYESTQALLNAGWQVD